MLYRSCLKRWFDFTAAFIGLVLTAPLWIGCAVLLFAANRGSVFFYQVRPGRKQVPFTIIKFKTMNDRRDAAGNLLPDHERTTAVGHSIRKLSLDELPQLINVLKGDMSLVGPRPLLFKYCSLYTPEQNRRHEVRPGITGWAQVNGRNAISWTRKFELDVAYVEQYSFLFDLKIIFYTISKVLRREGVNQTALRPMHPFNGSN